VTFTLAELAALAGGDLSEADAAAVVDAPVVADSRRVRRGSLFVAVPGARADGHDFAADAIRAGAVAVLATRPLGVPAIVVDDTVAALGRIARGHVTSLAAAGRLDIAGVTGSSGKTSTKDLLAQVLATAGETVAPEGSFNTEVGLPLTVLRADEATRFLVLEMSARGVGHIAYLCEIARPRIGAMLNVGVAHVGEFGSREAIARAKAELVEALPSAADGGVAVLNADDPLVAAMRDRTRARVVTFGIDADADVRARNIRLDGLARPSFVLQVNGESHDVGLRLHGGHHVANALAVAAVAIEAGLAIEAIAAALAAAAPASRWRMEVAERPDGVTVVNDAYNANPESVRAAVRALVAMSDAGRRRTWAVLGTMAELGDHAPAAHREIGAFCASSGVDEVVAVGADAALIADGALEVGLAPARVMCVADADAATALLAESVRPGDVVLVKASRSAGLERVAAGVLAGGVLAGGVPAGGAAADAGGVAS
jgi:UDP-N-acetylmuramoyl-tripeptide--D-alanyl-D-alanine ligase